MSRTRSFISVLILPCLPAWGSPAGATPSARVRADFEEALAEFDEAQSLQLEQPDRARQLFRLAAQRFSSIIAGGVVNGYLEYNAANCHLQTGDVGWAILHYRRGQRLIPRDPMLADNLAEARSRCLTTIRPARWSTFLKSVFFWHYQTSIAGRAKAALVCYLAIWALLIARNFLPNRIVTVLASLCAVVTVAAAASVAVTRWSDRNNPEGVVTASNVVVYKGPGTDYRRQFEEPLQPGVEFSLRERRGWWWRIELADGKSGWVGSSQAELLPRSPMPSPTELDYEAT